MRIVPRNEFVSFTESVALDCDEGDQFENRGLYPKRQPSRDNIVRFPGDFIGQNSTSASVTDEREQAVATLFGLGVQWGTGRRK